ncbi:MAG: hypothetical protein E7315_01685 [Clostridiales bacterium]|nr:hypothetical protein [Clostridiales bacterium]
MSNIFTKEEIVKRICNKMEAQPPEFFYTVPKEAQTHSILTAEPMHNAIWDMNVREDGRVFIAVCGEVMFDVYVKLYEYVYEKNEFRHIFDFNHKVIQHDRAIRPSKFHTSISFLPDGKLIMSTHTTARASGHPAWLPRSFANHQFEGYQGSNVVICDPDTGFFRNLGILAQAETIYGGVYNPHNNHFYGVGMFKGNLYDCDLDTLGVVNRGQVSDGPIWKLVVGKDTNVYSATFSGVLFRILSETGEVEYFEDYRVPTNRPNQHIPQLEDGTMLFTPSYSTAEFCTFNPLTGEYKRYPSGMPKTLPWDCGGVLGADFDSKGCLWYAIKQRYTPGSRLVKWDIFNGGEPVDIGVIGHPDVRTDYCTSELIIHDDIIYIADSNHGEDPVGIVAVDIRKITQKALSSKRDLTKDFDFYTGVANGGDMWPHGDYAKRLEEYIDAAYNGQDFNVAEHDEFEIVAPYEFESAVILWPRIGVENTKVIDMAWIDNETIEAVCTGEKTFIVRIKNGKLEKITQSNRDGAMRSALHAKIPEGLVFPCHPGRQYLSHPESSVKMADGSIIAGSYDGMLSRIKDGKVYSLGMVVTCGGIHSMCVDSTGTKVYGVAGYSEALGTVFTYDDENGIVIQGMCGIGGEEDPDREAAAVYEQIDVENVGYTDNPNKNRYFVFYATQPISCAISPDDKYLAIGTADKLGGVGIYKLK